MKGRKKGSAIDAAIQEYLWADYLERNVPKGLEHIRLTFTKLEELTGFSRRTIAYQLREKGASISVNFICEYAKAIGSTPSSFILKMVRTLQSQGKFP